MNYQEFLSEKFNEYLKKRDLIDQEFVSKNLSSSEYQSKLDLLSQEIHKIFY